MIEHRHWRRASEKMKHEKETVVRRFTSAPRAKSRETKPVWLDWQARARGVKPD
jgi:hypothetical protein